MENRNRFVLEVMQQLVDAIGEDKVGIILSPAISHNSIIPQDLTAQFKESD